MGRTSKTNTYGRHGPATPDPTDGIGLALDLKSRARPKKYSGQEEGATVVAGVAAALSGDGEQLASPLEQLLVGLGVAADVTGVLVLPGTGVP
ncbi:hypothetical protein [Mycobacterium haemophilum]|uniref:hypothetical protein n=1 Tax=Mycobacterium haemophilum TaxID=29311 RepID=UPI000699CC64|nr:hypothetical protein [Mycobacterium haemophilum]